ncbi:MAG: hypothetical protein LC775_10800 [Acidobacteria bacterium]|nr:hypothetical protein [Acidobacteriota bacterium]
MHARLTPPRPQRRADAPAGSIPTRTPLWLRPAGYSPALGAVKDGERGKRVGMQVGATVRDTDGFHRCNNKATSYCPRPPLLVFGGTRDRDDLQFWSTLAGERDEPILTTNLHGRVASRTVRKVPVLPPPQMANLPAGQVMVIRRGIPPVVGRVQMAWRRRDVRAAAFARRHPAWAMCLTRWADAFRAWRQRVVLVVRAGLAGGYDRTAALLGRTAALLGVLVLQR